MSGVGVDVVFFLAGIETPPPFVIEKDNKKNKSLSGRETLVN